MDKALFMKYFTARLSMGKTMPVMSVGNSMFPALRENDTLIIKSQNQYEIGDILLYEYKDEGMLTHRLLMIDGDKYYCKGDNSYRLEEISKEDIYGRVIYAVRNEEKIELICPPELPRDSLEIHYCLQKLNYDRQSLWESSSYQAYYHKYLEIHEEDEYENDKE